jgi:hypothetical protein
MLYGIPKDIYTSDGEKVEKTKDWLKIPLLSTNQKTTFLYKVELLRNNSWKPESVLSFNMGW